MERIRPEKRYVDISNVNLLIASFFSKRNILNDKDEFIDTLIFPIIQFLERKNKDEKFDLVIDEKIFTKELGLKFNGYTYGIGKIIRLSEIINDTLSDFIEHYFANNDVEEFYNKNSECQKLRDYKIETDIKNLTFGNLVNIIRNIVKTDTSFHSIDNLSTNAKRKEFRKSFVDYVEDRDCFTHGILYFEYPGFKPILRVKDKKGSDYYITYSKEIFLSNLDTFNYLYDTISKMKNHLKEL